MLFLGRSICGLTTGLNSVLVPLYVKELSPVVISGSMGSYNFIFVTIGVFIAAAVGLLITDSDTDNEV